MGYETVLDAIRDAFLRIHPFPDARGIRGPEWFEPFRPRIRAARDPDAATAVIEEVVATFRDGSTRLVATPADAGRALPPVVLGEIDGRILVVRAGPDVPLRPAEEVLRVDGVPVWSLVRTVSRRIAASTPAARSRGACARALAGPPGSEVHILVRLDARVQREVAVRRGIPLPEEPALWTRDLRDGAVLMRIARFVGDDLVDRFDAILENLRDRPGLVIDLRGNGGGSERIAGAIAGRFAARPALVRVEAWRDPGTEILRRTASWIEPRGPWTWSGGLAVLIDGGSAGACESFAAALEAGGGALLVGETTAGASAGTTTVGLPEEFAIRIARAMGVRAAGTTLDLGIPPHVSCPPARRALLEGRDEALEAAIDGITARGADPRRVPRSIGPPKPERPPVRVAVCQIRVTDGDIEGNTARIAAAAAEAARGGAQIACFPETALIGWIHPKAHALARPIPGPLSDAIGSIARRNRVFIAIGLTERVSGGIHDAAILVGPDGRILAKHRKINTLGELMDPPYLRGRPSDIGTADTAIGRIGLLICADTFVEDHLRRLRERRPDVVVVPYGWAAPREAWPAHGETLEGTVLRAARTIGAPVIGPNLIGEITCGPWTGRTYEGLSVACDARGKILFIGRHGEPEVGRIEVESG
ncbi:MAG: hypothetical protein JXP34_11760 [Planctomycetes bacterium]|nr:hypothetical protein [Planctomycetota bacterium]